MAHLNTVDNWIEIINHGGDRPMPQGDARNLLSAYNTARRRVHDTPLRRTFHRFMTNEMAPGQGPPAIPMGMTFMDFVYEMMNDTASLINNGIMLSGKRKSKGKKSKKSKKRVSRKRSVKKSVRKHRKSRK